MSARTLAANSAISGPDSPELSVVMPVYNEEACIADAVREVQAHVFPAHTTAELIVVDDGSSDGTGDTLAALAAADPRIRVVRQANGGHGPALLNGIAQVRGQFVLLLDSDRQILLEDYATAWARMSATDVLLGIRAARQDPLHRRLISMVMRLLIRVLFGVAVSDANAPFKIIRTAVIARAMDVIPAKARIPSVHLAVFASRAGCRVVQHPVAHRARASGRTSLRLARLGRFCVGACGEILRFRVAMTIATGNGRTRLGLMEAWLRRKIIRS